MPKPDFVPSLAPTDTAVPAPTQDALDKVKETGKPVVEEATAKKTVDTVTGG